MIRIMGKNKHFNRPQQGQTKNNQHNNQPVVEQKPVNAPLADIADTAPTVEYASEAELASLVTLLDKLEESAQLFGDLAVETVSTVISDIRNNITVTGSLNPENAAEIKKFEEEIALLEDEAGCNSPFTHVSEAAYKALEEGTDEICVKWKSNQELIREFGGEEVQQMTSVDHKAAIQQLAFQQVWAFVFNPIEVEGCPEALVQIDADLTEAYNKSTEEPQPEVQAQIAAV